jgi:hypothetical protein
MHVPIWGFSTKDIAQKRTGKSKLVKLFCDVDDFCNVSITNLTDVELNIMIIAVCFRAHITEPGI